MLREAFEHDPLESVSRMNTINAVAGTGRAALPQRRLCAVAWQLLQRAGFVCREPQPPAEGDWWFLTPAGKAALEGDFQGYLGLNVPGH